MLDDQEGIVASLLVLLIELVETEGDLVYVDSGGLEHESIGLRYGIQVQRRVESLRLQRHPLDTLRLVPAEL